MGYAFNENPMRGNVAASIGGVSPPGDHDHIRYNQGQLAAITQYRITAGVGVLNVRPGVDLDHFAGGNFKESQTFSTTTASLEDYWGDYGLT